MFFLRYYALNSSKATKGEVRKIASKLYRFLNDRYILEDAFHFDENFVWVSTHLEQPKLEENDAIFGY